MKIVVHVTSKRLLLLNWHDIGKHEISELIGDGLHNERIGGLDASQLATCCMRLEVDGQCLGDGALPIHVATVACDLFLQLWP